MTLTDAERERAATRLRQRLWGAAVLIAIAVIALPLILDGSGSESQFRRVENLREEPPRIVGGRGDGARSERGAEAGDIEDVGAAGAGDVGGGTVATASGDDAGDGRPVIRVGEDDPPDYFRDPPVSARAASESRRRAAGEGTPSAWVVQAGSFRDEANAVAVRDRLRRAGFATFVSDTRDAGTPLFRVQVGPVVDEGRAEAARAEVVRLLGRDAIVISWP